MSKEFHELLANSRALYEAMNRFDAYTAKALGVHPSDIRCLNALIDGKMTAGEISTRLGLSTGTVTALVNRLVKAGYAVRAVSAVDKRQVEISLDPNFAERAEKIYNSLGGHIGLQFDGYTLEQIAQSANAVKRLTEGFSLKRFERAPAPDTLAK
jgi:DNA-binding MarR family transcriptional regulator